MRNFIGGCFFGGKYMIDENGLINLATALIEQAKHDYDVLIENGDYPNAKYMADRDSRGLIGYILSWCTDDPEYFKKEVEKRTRDFSCLKIYERRKLCQIRKPVQQAKKN